MSAAFDWGSVGWDEFLAGVAGYRDRLSARGREDLAYRRCAAALANLSMAERAAQAPEIVRFLNSWACRVSNADGPPMLAAWVAGHADRLEAVATLSITDDELPVAEIGALYDDLLATGRTAVRNWADAANSKALHQLAPGLVVMWDRTIRAHASDYSHYTTEMRSLARRLVATAPCAPEDLEGWLAGHLGYATPKTLARYLDEFNWHVLVGSS